MLELHSIPWIKRKVKDVETEARTFEASRLFWASGSTTFGFAPSTCSIELLTLRRILMTITRSTVCTTTLCHLDGCNIVVRLLLHFFLLPTFHHGLFGSMGCGLSGLRLARPISTDFKISGEVLLGSSHLPFHSNKGSIKEIKGIDGVERTLFTGTF